MSGAVTIGINAVCPTDYAALFDTIGKFYPNIQLTIDQYNLAGHGPEYMMSKARAGTLSDIMFDDASPLPYYISQGWVYPLNDFVEGDKEYEYVPQSIRDSFTYNGNVFAVAQNVHFTFMILNLDVLDALNLEYPDLDWTTDDFAELLRKATNDTYSGTEDVFNLDANLSLTGSKDCTVLGYNYGDRSFHFTDVWTNWVQYEFDLRQIPGLEYAQQYLH